MEQIKEAFSKIKKDIESLNSEVSLLKSDLIQTREELIKICEVMINLDKKMSEREENKEKQVPTHNSLSSTTPTHNPTHNRPLKVLKDQNKAFSSGNEGVPTDRQTDRQTDNQQQNPAYMKDQNTEKFTKYDKKFPLKTENIKQIREKNEDFEYLEENSIDNAVKILDSLDSLKKEIRLKFKRLTNQEMLVFSTLYQLEEESGEVDYRVLSKRLALTESSVRDYIGRLIKKGIPVDKKRINNKTILLSVSTNLKKIASLSTIMQLRDL